MNAAVFERGFERAVDELMLLDQRLSGERARAHGDVEVIHRSGAVEDVRPGHRESARGSAR